MSHIKRIVCLLFCAVLSVPCGLAANVSSVGAVATDKAIYMEGEDILVTATGSGKDWVGLYLAGEVPGGPESIWWYYVDGDGNTPGSEKSLKLSEYHNQSRSDYLSIPEGEYTVILCANDGYDVIDSVNITVLRNTSKPEAPASVVYNRTSDRPGYAEGVVTITENTEGERPDSYVLFWGDRLGTLYEYTALPPVAAESGTTTFTFGPNTLIPEEATSLLAYAAKGGELSDGYAEAVLPDGASTGWGDPLYSFQVVSDTHITYDEEHIHNQHFAAMLTQIRREADSVGLFVNGDLTNTGLENEYAQFRAMMEKAANPPFYAVAGNHDLSGAYPEYAERFAKNAGNETGYFDHWIRDTHFIFLAGEVSGLNAQLNQEQLDWLRTKLEENRDQSRPIFVFLHQAIFNTVAGAFRGQGWDGGNEYQKLSAILKDYPEVILFSGHSHWRLNSPGTMRVRDADLPSIFSTSSCAYLWDDEANRTNIGIEGSEGYYLYVYDDKVIVRGRDFVSKQWVSAAQFVVENLAAAESPPTPTEPAETTTAAEPSPAPVPPAAEPQERGSSVSPWPFVIGGELVLLVSALALILRPKGKK
ncbi:MAG: metallophosphoesterase [Oscillospiraceae bacterium]|jgi:predicted phosphodiesterase|nr:metallophosphoesterase [Oscillospiraceae bacterium]